MKKLAFYDIEIANDPILVKWDPRKLLFAVGGIVDSEGYEHTFEDVDEYIEKLNSYDYCIGFNNNRFDNAVITNNSWKDLGFALNSLDMLEMIEKSTNSKFIVALNELSLATISEGKTEGMTGDKAPQLWADGHKGLVKEYCLQDCRLVKKLWEFGEKYGYVLIPPNKTGMCGSLYLKVPVKCFS